MFTAISYVGVLATWDPLKVISGFGCLWAPRGNKTELQGLILILLVQPSGSSSVTGAAYPSLPPSCSPTPPPSQAHPLSPFQNQQVPREKATQATSSFWACFLSDLEVKILCYLVSSLGPSGSFKKYMWPTASSCSHGLGRGLGRSLITGGAWWGVPFRRVKRRPIWMLAVLTQQRGKPPIRDWRGCCHRQRGWDLEIGLSVDRAWLLRFVEARGWGGVRTVIPPGPLGLLPGWRQGALLPADISLGEELVSVQYGPRALLPR